MPRFPALPFAAAALAALASTTAGATLLVTCSIATARASAEQIRESRHRDRFVPTVRISVRTARPPFIRM